MYGISSMRSYVVKRFSHFRHSRRRRMESASLLSRESTTLSFSKPQKGHFMTLGTAAIVAGESSTADWKPYAGPQPQHTKVYRIADSEPLHQVEAAEGGVLASSASWLSADSLRNDNLSRCASTNPSGTTATNVTSQSIIPQLAASSLGTSKRC